MTIRKLLLLVVLLSLLLSACTAQPTLPAATPTPAATGGKGFEKTDCWFKEPLGRDVECGWLTVPEDHAKPDGKTIKLAVARFKSDAATPKPDPIVYLEGGPGGSPLKAYTAQFDPIFGQLLADRDLILFDQRGTGYSEPSLGCPEIKQLALDTLDQDLSLDKSNELSKEAALKCRDRLAKEGVDFALFNTAQNAADIDALRQALGLEQINLYGTSYGTRLALTALRDHPQGIRSAVIDSVVPLQVDLFAQTPVNGAQALEKVFKTCEAEATCNENYPNLRQVFSDLKAKLDKQPAKFEVTLNTGEKKEALLNGDSLVGTLFQGLYATSLIPSFPGMIYAASDGKYDLLGGILAANLAQLDDISYGMYYSVHCQEEAPYTNVEQMTAVTKQNPDFAILGDTGTLSLCHDWKVPTAPAVENQAVTSDVPTLVFSGEFDPITPPSYGQEAAKTLSQSDFVMIPHAGHAASVSEDCPRNMLLAFLDDPSKKPAAACLTDMAQTKFSTPLNAADFKLVPFTESMSSGLGQSKLTGVLPAGWKKISTGAYSPNGKLTDQTALIMQMVPLPADNLLNVLKTQLKSSNVNVDFAVTEKRSANGIAWTVYSAKALTAAIDLALGEKDKMTYMLLMQSPLNDRDVLYDAVFLPAVDALQLAK
jgi:pimeloyl-ACP methyl ester carboxylesterase